MKTMLMKTSVVTLSAILLATGCQQTSMQVSQRRPQAATTGQKPAPKPQPQSQTCADPTRGLVSLAKQMPKEATLGQTFEYQLNMTAQDCVDNVVVTDRIPAGATYVKSEPAAQVEGDKLTWRITPMDGGQTGMLRVWLKADKEGTLASCATISADPRVCGTTFVGRPTLSIDKSGPETATLGSTVNYTILVANNGSAVAKSVVVTDTVPAGLESADGRKQLTYEVGDLGPSQTKTITVPLRAATRGRHCNVAVATSSNAGSVTNDACTTVLQPGLEIVKTGDKERFLGRTASYRIGITNTGDTALSDVVVTDTAPVGTTISSASGATITGNQATWRLATLPKGGSQSFAVVLNTQTAGSYCNVATVVAAGGLSDRAESCTVWRGISALLLEKADDPDPIQVGESITYTVRVTNQGTAADTNVKMVVEFPAEVTPLSADNGGVVSGRTVTFPPFASLAPKQAFEYHIKAKGEKTGDARVTFVRTSDGTPAPTTAEESTRVY